MRADPLPTGTQWHVGPLSTTVRSASPRPRATPLLIGGFFEARTHRGQHHPSSPGHVRPPALMLCPTVSAMRSSAFTTPEQRTRVDLSRCTRAQQRLNLRQVVEDPISIDIALAELVRLSTSQALKHHVRGSAQQHNSVEARIELSLVGRELTSTAAKISRCGRVQSVDGSSVGSSQLPGIRARAVPFFREETSTACLTTPLSSSTGPA